MISQLITGGTTLIVARKGLFHGAHLMNTPSGVSLTAHDTDATATFAAANQIDKIWGGTAAGTLQPMINATLPRPVTFFNGLVTWMTAAGTATVFYE